MKYLISLGSNMGNRAENLAMAVKELRRIVGEVIVESTVYETPPWGFDADQSFYNQVVCMESELVPLEFLELVLQIERSLGRKRNMKIGYASRKIDIDILLVDELIVESRHLTIPHPEMHNRRFVLKPAVDIAPNWRHPVCGLKIKQLLEMCNDESEVSPL